jgi:hypothetical protein
MHFGLAKPDKAIFHPGLGELPNRWQASSGVTQAPRERAKNERDLHSKVIANSNIAPLRRRWSERLCITLHVAES